MQTNGTHQANAHRYFFKNLKKERANFLLYPYSFSLPTLNETFSEGAMLTLNNISLPDNDSADYFKYVSGNSTINTRRAKALYDVGVGILQLESDGGNGPGNFLTIEAHSYCYPLYNYIGGKFASCWKSDDYENYLKKFGVKAERTSVVYLNGTDIRRGLLFNGLDLRFGVLVIGNIYDGKEAEIYDVIGREGAAQIRSFVQRGGVVYASGKGALVAEKLGLVRFSQCSRSFYR